MGRTPITSTSAFLAQLKRNATQAVSNGPEGTRNKENPPTGNTVNKRDQSRRQKTSEKENAASLDTLATIAASRRTNQRWLYFINYCLPSLTIVLFQQHHLSYESCVIDTNNRPLWHAYFTVLRFNAYSIL